MGVKKYIVNRVETSCYLLCLILSPSCFQKIGMTEGYYNQTSRLTDGHATLDPHVHLWGLKYHHILMLEFMRQFNSLNINQMFLPLLTCISAYVNTWFFLLCFLLRSFLGGFPQFLPRVSLLVLFSLQGTLNPEIRITLSLLHLFLVRCQAQYHVYLNSNAVAYLEPCVRLRPSFSLLK